jgi:hypothetical protein
VLSVAFSIAWLDTFTGGLTGKRRLLSLVTAALSMGLLALTRPLTAIGVALPFGLHGVYLLIRGDRQIRLLVILFGVLTLGLGSLHLVWQYALTGDPFLNPYTLWWPYDKVGFGPEVGRYGHTLTLARTNTRFSLLVGWRDLFGWGSISWIFLPFGLWALRRHWRGLMVAGVAPSLVVIYLFYWVGAWLYGPRYYYEGLFSLTLLSAVGIAWIAGWPFDRELEGVRGRWQPGRALVTTAFLALLVAANLIFYTPLRLQSMQGLYGIDRQKMTPFLTAEAKALTPALIIVYPTHWTEYGGLLALEDPFLTSPFIFTFSRGPGLDAELAATFSDRSVFHYYPDEPYKFYTGPRN